MSNQGRFLWIGITAVLLSSGCGDSGGLKTIKKTEQTKNTPVSPVCSIQATTPTVRPGEQVTLVLSGSNIDSASVGFNDMRPIYMDGDADFSRPVQVTIVAPSEVGVYTISATVLSASGLESRCSDAFAVIEETNRPQTDRLLQELQQKVADLQRQLAAAPEPAIVVRPPQENIALKQRCIGAGSRYTWGTPLLINAAYVDPTGKACVCAEGFSRVHLSQPADVNTNPCLSEGEAKNKIKQDLCNDPAFNHPDNPLEYCAGVVSTSQQTTTPTPATTPAALTCAVQENRKCVVLYSGVTKRGNEYTCTHPFRADKKITETAVEYRCKMENISQIFVCLANSDRSFARAKKWFGVKLTEKNGTTLSASFDPHEKYHGPTGDLYRRECFPLVSANSQQLALALATPLISGPGSLGMGTIPDDITSNVNEMLGRARPASNASLSLTYPDDFQSIAVDIPDDIVFPMQSQDESATDCSVTNNGTIEVVAIGANGAAALPLTVSEEHFYTAGQVGCVKYLRDLPGSESYTLSPPLEWAFPAQQ